MTDKQMSIIVLTIEEAAQYLKLCSATVRRACKSGQIPAAKVGRAWRIDKEELDRYLKGQNGAKE